MLTGVSRFPDSLEKSVEEENAHGVANCGHPGPARRLVLEKSSRLDSPFQLGVRVGWLGRGSWSESIVFSSLGSETIVPTEGG